MSQLRYIPVMRRLEHCPTCDGNRFIEVDAEQNEVACGECKGTGSLATGPYMPIPTSAGPKLYESLAQAERIAKGPLGRRRGGARVLVLHLDDLAEMNDEPQPADDETVAARKLERRVARHERLWQHHYSEHLRLTGNAPSDGIVEARADNARMRVVIDALCAWVDAWEYCGRGSRQGRRAREALDAYRGTAQPLPCADACTRGCDASCNSDCACGSTHHYCGCECHRADEQLAIGAT